MVNNYSVQEEFLTTCHGNTSLLYLQAINNPIPSIMRSNIQEYEAVGAAAAKFVQGVSKTGKQNPDTIQTEATLV